MIGLATVQPGQKFTQLAFAALSGLGFGGPIILIIAAVQLATPHHLIATSTAVTTSSRAVGATIFTAIYGAALSQGLKSKIPRYVAAAVTKAGLPAISWITVPSSFHAREDDAKSSSLYFLIDL